MVNFVWRLLQLSTFCKTLPRHLHRISHFCTYFSEFNLCICVLYFCLCLPLNRSFVDLSSHLTSDADIALTLRHILIPMKNNPPHFPMCSRPISKIYPRNMSQIFPYAVILIRINPYPDLSIFLKHSFELFCSSIRRWYRLNLNSNWAKSLAWRERKNVQKFNQSNWKAIVREIWKHLKDIKWPPINRVKAGVLEPHDQSGEAPVSRQADREMLS